MKSNDGYAPTLLVVGETTTISQCDSPIPQARTLFTPNDWDADCPKILFAGWPVIWPPTMESDCSCAASDSTTCPSCGDEPSPTCCHSMWAEKRPQKASDLLGQNG